MIKIKAIIEKYGFASFEVLCVLLAIEYLLRFLTEAHFSNRLKMGYLITADEINSVAMQLHTLDYFILTTGVLLIITTPITLYSIFPAFAEKQESR